MSEQEYKKTVLGMPAEWAVEILKMVVIVVVVYFTNMAQGERNLATVKEQSTQQINLLDQRVGILEHDKERDARLLDSRHAELKSQIESLASKIEVTNQAINSVDQFTQQLAGDIHRTKGDGR